jgi:uncharacterized Zn-binding protein involved in type VI secretion
MAGLPIATTKPGGICFAFPDICNTPTPPGPTPPIPYPNVGQLQDAIQTSDGSVRPGPVKVGGEHVILKSSQIQTTTGDEAGSASPTKGPVAFEGGSATVQIHGQAVVRMGDPTVQNNRNARGTVLGDVPNVLVGG